MEQTPLAEQSPVEIDTQLAEINQQAARPTMWRSSALRVLEAEEGEYDSWSIQRAEERLQQAEEQIEALRLKAKPFHDEFDRRDGWTRFYHVTNANGHVHNSTHCTSCFFDTQYAWRTDLSGLTEAEVVEREAYQACSVCMPIAPAEQKAAFKVHQQEKRDAKKRERAEKAAEKARKKFAREESAAHKANAALDKYGDDYLKQAWYDNKITDATYDILHDAGRAGNEGKY